MVSGQLGGGRIRNKYDVYPATWQHNNIDTTLTLVFSVTSNFRSVQVAKVGGGRRLKLVTMVL